MFKTNSCIIGRDIFFENWISSCKYQHVCHWISVIYPLFILIVCFVSLRTCTCTFLSHSDKLIHEIFARHAALYLVLEKMITIFGKLWNEIQNSLQYLFHFRKSFALCKWFFGVVFSGFYFCLFFFFFLKWVGMGVNKHVQHYYAKVGRRKTARSFLTDSDHQKIRNATDTFHLDFLGNPALKKKNYKVSTIIN